MPAADSSGPNDAPKFRSPKRTLAHAFRLSRDRWKKKATERRAQLRAMKVRLRDVQTSRLLWKKKALHLQEQLHHLLGLTAEPLPEDAAASAPPEPNLTDFDSPPPTQAAGLDPAPAEPVPAAVTPPPPTGAATSKKKRRR